MRKEPLPVFRRGVLIALLFSFAAELPAQMTGEVYAEGLTIPIGIAIDSLGRLWVAELGSADGDGRISVVTTDGQVHPFLEGLPSELNAADEITGPNYVYFDEEGNLLIVQGEGTDTLSASILVVDTAGFAPGDPPLGREVIDSVYDIGTFVFDEGFEESNPYTLAFGPGGDWFIVDAAANAVIRRDSATGELDVFTVFPDVQNNTGTGPPVVDAVPTGIAVRNDSLYVGTLTGFPFPDSAATLYTLDSLGVLASFRDSLTQIVDVVIDPRDSLLVILQHAVFSPPPPFPDSTGAILKLGADGSIDTLASGLNRPTGMRFDSTANLFVATFEGTILRFEAMSTGIGRPSNRAAERVNLRNYPNPFSQQTRITYELDAASRVLITVTDLSGREVRRLVDQMMVAGPHEVFWDGRDNGGNRLMSGVYFYRIQCEQGVAARQVVFVR